MKEHCISLFLSAVLLTLRTARGIKFPVSQYIL